MFRIFLAYGLLICLALPVAQTWQHARKGHLEIPCPQDNPNHVHQAESSCDFYKYPVSVNHQAPDLEFGVSAEELPYRTQAHWPVSPEQAAQRFYTLRAPPA